MPQATSDQSFESIWAELKQLLEWQQGFALYFVLGDDQRVSKRLRERVQDFTATRTRGLQWVKPEQAETVVLVTLEAVFPTGGGQAVLADLHAPIWLELTTAPGDPAWALARRKTLAALNQRRGQLERECLRPLFVQVPVTMAPELVVWAPDLWSIREYIAILPTDTLRHGEPPEALRDLSISLDSLGDAERAGGRLEAALTAYRESLELSRQLRAVLGDTPQVLRDVSVSLDSLAAVTRGLGDSDASVSYQREYQAVLALIEASHAAPILPTHLE